MYAIDNQDQIDKVQSKLGKLLKKESRHETRRLGYQKGNDDFDVWLFDDYQLWWSPMEGGGYWNAFGIYDNTREWKNNGEDIICEINLPIETRRTQGVCVSDGKKTYIAHTGKLNGPRYNKKYCTMDSFKKYAKKLNWRSIKWYDGSQKKVVIISNLDDDDLIINIRTFMEVVYKYKKGTSAYPTKPVDAQYKSKDDVANMSKAEIRRRLQEKPRSVKRSEYVVRKLERDNDMTQLIKQNRGYRCQICNKGVIKKKDGTLYVEAAHIKPKNEGGDETHDNIMILCPNHHAEFDMGEKKITKHTKTEIQFVLNGKKYKVRLGIW